MVLTTMMSQNQADEHLAVKMMERTITSNDYKIEVVYDGAPLEIGFNANYIIDALSSIRTEQVVMNITDSSSSCLLTPDGDASCRYVVMPMRL